MTYSICYFSTINAPLTEDELYQLLHSSANKNKKDDITGILIYADGNFMQVLEGQEKLIKKLYRKISRDRRHKNVIKVSEMMYTDKIFEAYGYGFTVIDDKENINSLNKYLDWLHNHPSEKIATFINLMKQFTQNT